MKNLFTALLIILSFAEAKGQNLHRFRYIFDKERFSNNIYIKSGVIKDTVRTKKIITIRTLNPGTNSYTYKTDSTYKLDTVSVFLKKGIVGEKLFGLVSKRDADTLFLDFWGFEEGNGKNSPDMVNDKNIDSTFHYIVSEKTWSANRWGNNRFTVPFRAHVFTPSSIPFRVRFNSGAQLETSFLNAGISYFFLLGKTKFYQEETVAPRMNYWGFGAFGGFSQLKLDKNNTDDKVLEERNIGSISYGANIIRSIHNFNFIIALGFENAVGKDAGKWEYNNFNGGIYPWIGFGVGLKVLDLALKPTFKE